MNSKTRLQTLAGISEIEMGFEESAVIQVEAGDAKGYLISEAYAVGDPPSEITLHNVIYFCAWNGTVEKAEAAAVVVSTRNDCWFAVETGEVAIIPCPSLEAYPIIFISKHGYRWMQTMILHGNAAGLLEHLDNRFPTCGFVTSRKILDDPAFPFSLVAQIRTHPVEARRSGLSQPFPSI